VSDSPKWPTGVRVGHSAARPVVTLTAASVELTPAEARAVAEELLIRADLQDRNGRATVDRSGVPRRVPT